MEKTDIRSYTLNELKESMESAGEKGFRAVQIYEWLHKKNVQDFADMTNLPAALREKLSRDFALQEASFLERLISKDSQTEKYLFRLRDGKVIESVLMRYHHGASVCISSQAGCRMGCRFCASGIGGLERSLTASELLAQVYEIGRLSGERISHVVVMGTGEPLDNFDALIRFLTILTDENGMNISQRNITVSTCGLVEGMLKLSEYRFQITLAVSLHAPDDETRKRIMPSANRYSIPEIMNACRIYFERTGRRITFEYSLISGVNDSLEHARALAALLKGMNCHVNLIPVNPVKELGLKQSEAGTVQNFKNLLEKNRINVTIRREMGTDINAACGQLRKRYLDKETDGKEGPL